VASEAVPCVFLAGPHPQRHITADATEDAKNVSNDGGLARARSRGKQLGRPKKDRGGLKNCPFALTGRLMARITAETGISQVTAQRTVSSYSPPQNI
jgi:hypothetical protein